ncbi:hypothetical protein C4E04_03660 [Microvirga sp. 17 mud 1-3]|nr:hypothetical protein C4E04_03660 [Microvirga sp. 17 mud 1-3]
MSNEQFHGAPNRDMGPSAFLSPTIAVELGTSCCLKSSAILLRRNLQAGLWWIEAYAGRNTGHRAFASLLIPISHSEQDTSHKGA